MLIHGNFKPYMAKKEGKKYDTSRFSGLLLMISLAFCGLASYSFFINKPEAKLDERSKNKTEQYIIYPALRGAITDRNGNVLAVSRHLQVPTFSPANIYKPKRQNEAVNLKTISDKQFTELATLLRLPVEEVRAKLTDIEKRHVVFDVGLTSAEAEELKKLRIPTLSFEIRQERTYPTGNLFSHIVGFTDPSGLGLEGLENTQEGKLKGEDGKQAVLHDAYQNFIKLLDRPDNRVAKDGQTLVLSLDQQMQRLAYDQLSLAVKKYNARAGGAVVLDAQTGEVLAMVGLPDYDANFYQSYPKENYHDFSVSVNLEPGSVMKPFIVAKAIDDGKIGRNTLFNTKPYKIGTKLIQDTHVYPSLTTEGVLQKSSNVGVSRIALLYSNQELFDYYSKIGLGKKTQSGAPGEQYARIRPASQWGKLDKAVMSYGYGINANLLQLAQGYTIFTTNGRLMPATIFKTDHVNGGIEVIKPETARLMREMMISITKKGGTGQAGAIAGYDVAAKTGTARKAGQGGYGKNGYRASFVGFAPAQNPRLIVAVTIDEPKGHGFYGGVVAAPAFREIMAGSLKLLNVSPTYPEELTVAKK